MHLCLLPPPGCAPHTWEQEFEQAVYADLKSLAEYFGEDYTSSDPTRILRTVRDFMRLYHRAISDIEVRVACTAFAMYICCL